MISPTVGAGKWIGRISVSVSATEAKNFRRDIADCFGSQSGCLPQGDFDLDYRIIDATDYFAAAKRRQDGGT